MKVSVIIPTRNRAHMLGEAINSVLSQSLSPYEILIVDDGSEDDTPSIISNFNGRVRSIRQDASGKSRALNTGIANSEGDLVIVLDDDDLFPLTALENHVSALKSSPQIGFSFGRFQRFRELPPLSIKNLTHHDISCIPSADPRRTAVKLMEACFLPNPSWMARRSALHLAGPYDEAAKRSQDYDMILRLARFDDGAFVDDVVLYQRQHDAPRAACRNDSLIDSWIFHDRILMERLDDTWSLADFRPFKSNLEDQGEALAWLQRGVAMFIRKAYDRAFNSLGHYRMLLNSGGPSFGELAIARTLLTCHYGIDDLIGEDADPNVADSLRSYSWPPSLNRAFCSHLRWPFRQALKKGEYKKASNIARFGVRAFGLIAWSQCTIGREMERLSNSQKI